MDDRRFREGFRSIVEEAPAPPQWETLAGSQTSSWRAFARRPSVAFLAGALFVILTIGVTAIVGGETPAPPAGTSTTTSTIASTTLDPGPDDPLVIDTMACGFATAPISPTIPEGSELDQDAVAALESLARDEGRLFVDNHEFRLWSKDADEMVLYGESRSPGPPRQASAHFELRDGQWAPTGFSQCFWQPVIEAYGLATWRLAGDVDRESTTFTLLATEQHCASGQPPGDREVLDQVTTDDTSVTVIILVEPVQGAADCQGNPEFEYEVTLDEPIGDRLLLDGVRVPPEVRHRPDEAGSCPAPDAEVGVEYLEIHLRCGEDGLFGTILRPVEDDPDVSPGRLLRELLAGPTEEELAAGFVSVFGPDTANALETFEVEGTTAFVDFNEGIQMNNASTATGSVELQAELLQNIFMIHQLETVEFRIDGSCEAWSTLLQSAGCRTYTRDDLLGLLDQLD